MKRTFSVKGMHCASCAMIIEKALSKVEGVSSAVVNFAAEKVTIEFNENKVEVEKIAKAVEDVGYKLIMDEKNDQGRHGEKIEDTEKIREIHHLKRKVAISGIFSVIVLVGAITKLLTPEIQFIITTPVLFWGGSQFFQGAWRSIKNFTANMDTLIAVGTSAAYFYSVLVTISLITNYQLLITSEVYFDTAAVVITLILLGRFLETRAKGQAGAAIKKLMGLQPKEATVLLEKGDERLGR